MLSEPGSPPGRPLAWKESAGQQKHAGSASVEVPDSFTPRSRLEIGFLSWGWCSLAEALPNTCKALSSIPSTWNFFF